MSDFLFHGDLAQLDPAVAELIEHEAERQARKLILVPSESAASKAVREALGSVFQNIYAEGYPDPRTRAQTEPEILDYVEQLGAYRRYGDPRYYKGVEYADIVEALARRRCAELFATPIIGPARIFVNVQPLSGAPANNAVYEALLKPGDTVMGMSLVVGGHLTHGSPVNRSGRHFKIVAYDVDPATEQLDYDQLRDLARQHKPKMIIAGYTSYPYAPDWSKFRSIADEVGAVLLADISHVAGLVAAGAFPSPLGAAHVITFTTHKTLCGPRGACILTLDASLSRKIDRAVFPGEQGGPHVNAIAGMAVAFKLAAAEEFKQLQHQVVKNAVALAKALENNGLRIAYGGTSSHLLLVDCKSVKAKDGTPLMGDPAARILDLANIVCNRNTIPGDRGAGAASGIRFGTPWVTQRGLKEADMERLGELIAGVLKACTPFTYDARSGEAFRAKVDFDVVENAKLEVAQTIKAMGDNVEAKPSGYPHFWSLADTYGATAVFEIRDDKARSLLQHSTTNDVDALKDGDSQPTFLLEKDGRVMAGASLKRVDAHTFHLAVMGQRGARVAAWLRALSDGFASFDDDAHAKLAGPVSVKHLPEEQAAGPIALDLEGAVAVYKPYFIGMRGESFAKVLDPSTALRAGPSQGLPEFTWAEDHDAPLKRTTLYETHKKMGAKMVPFAGWEMPVWYTGVIEEHRAVREAAGIFDVSHMGVLDASGPNTAAFLDLITTNDVAALGIGNSHYSYLLGPDGIPIDDLMIYRIEEERYLIVVNASNNDKDWAWINAVNEGTVRIDAARPWARSTARCALRDLRDRQWGDERRVDIALQGPKSLAILQSICDNKADAARLGKMPRTDVMRATLKGFDVIISRTGYTGESVGYELFVHPNKAPAFWELLVEIGTPMGMKPIGLGARDSLRTEAGLPLYGHELAGPLNMNPADAGFASYVKTYKPFFVGRAPYLARDAGRKMENVRFRMNDKGVRVPKGAAALETGGDMDYVVDKRGRVIGRVLSCAVDSEGYMNGQALVETKYAVEGTPIGILPASKDAKPASDLKIGSRVPTIDPAMVVSRFPKRK
ncbi:MAG TPA: glycine cleavage system aminomethyltransferase GcvT [Anaerolineae bacterium]|nr:glycine cleavage system aminomethyltransferase GcvT [Anaerolineae bacterium]